MCCKAMKYNLIILGHKYYLDVMIIGEVLFSRFTEVIRG